MLERIALKAQKFIFSAPLLLFSIWSYGADGWQSRVQPVSNPADNVTLFSIAGSNTVGAKLAPRLVAAFLQQEGFNNVEIAPLPGENRQQVTGLWQARSNNYSVAVTIEAKGSSTGFKNLLAGGADLAASSRPIKNNEVKRLAKLGDMRSLENEHIIAIDGLAIVVNPANPVDTLSLKSIQNLFLGKSKDWSEVSGQKGPVVLLARNYLSGTFDTFKRLVLENGTLAPNIRRFEANSKLAETVLARKNSIGFVPLPSVGLTKAIQISDGVAQPLAPSTLTVATEDYPLSRRLYFYSRASSQRKEVVSEFLEFVHSDDGQAVVGQAGYVAQSLFAVPLASDDPRLAGWSRMNLNIRFVDGSSGLDNKSLNDVKRLADFLSRPGNQNKSLTLVGFSNPVGGGVSRVSLSRLRAQNVRWALRDQNVKNKAATIAGSAVSVADPKSLNAERNRRVEVWVK